MDTLPSTSLNVATIRRLNAAIAGPWIGLRSSLALHLVNPDLLIVLGIFCSPMRMSIDGCCGRPRVVEVRCWRRGKVGGKEVTGLWDCRYKVGVE